MDDFANRGPLKWKPIPPCWLLFKHQLNGFRNCKARESERERERESERERKLSWHLAMDLARTNTGTDTSSLLNAGSFTRVPLFPLETSLPPRETRLEWAKKVQVMFETTTKGKYKDPLFASTGDKH